jgi:hypothetical protein
MLGRAFPLPIGGEFRNTGFKIGVGLLDRDDVRAQVLYVAAGEGCACSHMSNIAPQSWTGPSTISKKAADPLALDSARELVCMHNG